MILELRIAELNVKIYHTTLRTSKPLFLRVFWTLQACWLVCNRCLRVPTKLQNSWSMSEQAGNGSSRRGIFVYMHNSCERKQTTTTTEAVSSRQSQSDQSKMKIVCSETSICGQKHWGTRDQARTVRKTDFITLQSLLTGSITVPYIEEKASISK